MRQARSGKYGSRVSEPALFMLTVAALAAVVMLFGSRLIPDLASAITAISCGAAITVLTLSARVRNAPGRG